MVETPSKTLDRGLGKPLNAAMAGFSTTKYWENAGMPLTNSCTACRLELIFCTARKKALGSNMARGIDVRILDF